MILIKVTKYFATSLKVIRLNNTENFDVLGSIKWLKEMEEVDSYGYFESLREAILYTNEDDIPVTVWKDVLDELTEKHGIYFKTFL